MARGMQIAASMLMLLIGGLTYLLFRPTTLVLFQLVRLMGLEDAVLRWREEVAGARMPEFVVYCLPNGLWAAAYVLLIHALLMGQPAKTRLLAVAVIPLIGVVAEAMQAFGFLPGTYDNGDIACLLAPLAAYAAFIYKQHYNN